MTVRTPSFGLKALRDERKTHADLLKRRGYCWDINQLHVHA